MELIKIANGEYESPDGEKQLSINNGPVADEGFYEDFSGLYNFEIDRTRGLITWDIEPGKSEELEEIIWREID